MSERGSFTTEYIYCDKCLKAACRILLGKEKYLCSSVAQGYGSITYLPIIHGKIGGSWSGEEAFEFENNLIPVLEAVICHPLTVAVIPENTELAKIFTAQPPAYRRQQR